MRIFTFGNALPADVRAGRVFNAGVNFMAVGTMADKTGQSIVITPGTADQAIAQGYYDGTTGAGKVSGAATLLAANVKYNVSIFGVNGSYDYEASNPIAVATVLSGKVGFVNGAKVTGVMTNKVGSATVLTPGATDQAVPQGYYGGATGDGKVLGDTDLIAANIKSGVSIFGLAGSYVTPTIQSIQRGQTSIPVGVSSITISSVNINAALVKCMDIYIGGTYIGHAVLTSATTVEFHNSFSSAQTVNWEVIEFNPDTVRGVQRGSLTFAYTPDPFTVTIDSINPAKAMLILGPNGGYSSGAYAYILDATTLAFKSFNSGVTVYWQVIEFK